MGQLKAWLFHCITPLGNPLHVTPVSTQLASCHCGRRCLEYTITDKQNVALRAPRPYSHARTRYLYGGSPLTRLTLKGKDTSLHQVRGPLPVRGNSTNLTSRSSRYCVIKGQALTKREVTHPQTRTKQKQNNNHPA